MAVNHKCSLRNCSPQLFPISQSIWRRFDNFANVEENIRSKCQMPGNWKQERIKCMSAQFCFSALPIIWVKSGPKHTKNAKQMLSFGVAVAHPKCKHCSHIINWDNWWWKSIISIFQNFILKFSFLSKCIRFYPVFLFYFSGQMQHFQEEMSILHIIFKVFSCECGRHIYVLPINFL